MPKTDLPVLTEAEQRVMRVLWAEGEASVRDVMTILSQKRPTAYTTVLTLLRILTDKGYVAPRKQGKAFIYRPLVERHEARSRALGQLISQFFEGSPTELAQHLVKDTTLTSDDLDMLRQELKDARTREENS